MAKLSFLVLLIVSQIIFDANESKVRATVWVYIFEAKFFHVSYRMEANNK